MNKFIDVNSNAAKDFYNAVRLFSETASNWNEIVSYETKPDEELDVSLVSLRVYGNREEILCVYACANIDVTERLTPRTLIMPDRIKLAAIKQSTGFESNASFRKNGSPLWL